MTYTDDPVLRLLPPSPPDSFLGMTPDEQAWRGRAWIAMYGAGYNMDHAWWFVLQNDPDFTAYMKDLLSRVPNDPKVYASMIQARIQFDRTLAAQVAAGPQ